MTQDEAPSDEAARPGLTYKANTDGVLVSVTPAFMPSRSQPEQAQFFWAYTVEIENQRSGLVQLIARHWLITDGRGKLEEVKGLGVVGEQPVLQPGESFRYTSGCSLTTRTGIMTGRYRMVDERGTIFEVAIPTFSLDFPDPRRVLN